MSLLVEIVRLVMLAGRVLVPAVALEVTATVVVGRVVLVLEATIRELESVAIFSLSDLRLSDVRF